MIKNRFDCVATGYDQTFLSFFPKTAKRLVQRLNLELEQHLLDVCGGAGVVALAVAVGDERLWFNADILITVGEK